MPRVAQSTSVVTLLEAGYRKGYLIHNDSTAKLRIKFGAGATLTDYAVELEAGDLYESPFGSEAADIQVTGIWDAAGSGAAQVTSV